MANYFCCLLLVENEILSARKRRLGYDADTQSTSPVIMQMMLVGGELFVQSRPGAPSCALCFPRLAHIILEKHDTFDFVWIFRIRF